MLLAAWAGWVDRHEHAAIDYLGENSVLKEQLGERRQELRDPSLLRHRSNS
jgi:hypothetical protein